MPFVNHSDGSTTYITADGDTVSWIADEFFGTQVKTTEAILEVNPGLAAKPVRLPAGLSIRMPPPPAKLSPKPTINIWE